MKKYKVSMSGVFETEAIIEASSEEEATDIARRKCDRVFMGMNTLMESFDVNSNYQWDSIITERVSSTTSYF